MSVVSIKSLTKRYSGQSVVDAIDLDVREGECFGLLGPNGAGKTTTLRMLLGMTPPDAGELTVLGQRIPQLARNMRTQVGVVPQMDNLDPDFTVAENLRTYASYFGLSGSAVEQRIATLLDFAHLAQRANASIDSLSGGMKRRLTLARALVNDPRLLILDEPTTGLDPQARQLIWQRLRELKQQGHTLILTTHYMEEAQRLCDRLAIMDHGRIVAVGSPRELIQTHIEPHVIELYGPGVARWRAQFQPEPDTRFEAIGESLFVYLQQEAAAIQDLCRFHDIEFLHRRANLEDVFLKLTGRELRE
jgi:lipooligosaccharide transport system ATP-binding protein